MQVHFRNSIFDINAEQWNKLISDDTPFLRHEFLSALESEECVGGESGWQPYYACLEQDNKLIASVPLYLKEHSWGEFVFDWAWAEAYERCGLPYYPKLVATVPFTPITTAKILSLEHNAKIELQLINAIEQHAKERELSSIHLLFLEQETLSLLQQQGFFLRQSCQYHWFNDQFVNFDDYLNTLNSRKRKAIKRERRRIEEAGITFKCYQGEGLSEAVIAQFHQFYCMTYWKKGHAPPLTECFFQKIVETLPNTVMIMAAHDGSRIIAMAFFYVSANALYGRYWGCVEEYHSLHFATCYYQGIAYCIEHNVPFFHSGTQGEHKISRGFRPVATWSAHRIFNPVFDNALQRYTELEADHIDKYIKQVETHHLPFKKLG